MSKNEDHEPYAYLHGDECKGLERKAVALVKQYGFFLPKPVKAFFHELADFLNWQELKKEL